MRHRKKFKRKNRKIKKEWHPEKILLSHDTLVDILFNRLYSKGKHCIEKNVEYKQNREHGEVDVLVYEPESETHYFYEVKSYFSRKTYRKALEQFAKFLRAYPERKTKGIFVSPQLTWRIDLAHPLR